MSTDLTDADRRRRCRDGARGRRPPPSRSPRPTSTGSRPTDGELGAYLHVDPEAALARAAEIDAAGDDGAAWPASRSR